MNHSGHEEYRNERKKKGFNVSHATSRKRERREERLETSYQEIDFSYAT